MNKRKDGFTEDGKGYVVHRGGHSVVYPSYFFGGPPKKKRESNSAQLENVIRRIVAEELKKMT